MTVLGVALPARRHRSGKAWRHVLAALAARWQHARRLRETRRYIQEMDEHMLSDIGLSRAQALFEIGRARRGK